MLVDMGIHSYYGLPIRDAEGNPMGLLVALHDAPTDPPKELETILELFAIRAGAELRRQRTEAQLRASELRYRQIISTCLEGVWTIDRDGATTFANEQMANILGTTPDAMLGRSMYDFMDDEGRKQAERNMARRASGVAEHHDFCFVRADGTEALCELSANPMYEDGEYAGALALVTDVTERRALERTIQHSHKLESLGILAGGIAHDFNNLLVGILGNASLALGQLPANAATRSHLEDVRTAAVRASELTQQMLAYAGRGSFSEDVVSMNDIITEMVDLLRSALSKNTELRLELAPALPSSKGDPAQLRQIVMNLITNASDALGDDPGTVTITTRTIDVGDNDLHDAVTTPALAPGEYVCIEVVDTGCGMTADTRERIFDPFFTTKFTGRGLGLAAVHGILRGHGGMISVRSELGTGSTFTVLLPSHHGGAEATEERTEEPNRAAIAGTLLVVDDESIVREVACAVLMEAGFEVITAADGREALEQVRSHGDTLAAVLLDMTLPVMSGAQAFRELQELAPNLPVVLTSGFHEQDISGQLAGKVPAGFLQKPWHADDLVLTMERAINRS
jgi:PAS domain S-box-containing protein